MRPLYRIGTGNITSITLAECLLFRLVKGLHRFRYSPFTVGLLCLISGDGEMFDTALRAGMQVRMRERLAMDGCQEEDE